MRINSEMGDEEERLAALYARGILDTPPEERFDRVTRLARRLFGVNEALVNLIDRDRQWTKSIAGADAMPDLPREDSFCATAILDADGLFVEDTFADERFKTNPLVTADTPMRFYCGVPIASPDGHRVGTLCLADSAPRQLSAPDIDLLRDLALWVEQELNIDSERDRAAEVQRALLPAKPPIDTRWDVAGGCRTSRDVGGDFYDWYRVGDATTVVVADVMGKGMPAAIIAATARAALRAGAVAGSAAATITHAAETLATDLAATDTFVTVFAAHLTDDGLVRYADAGHGHAAVARADGTTESLERGGVPIGIGFDESYVDHELRLDPGDLLIAHSDGLIELPGGPRTTEDVITHLRASASASEGIRTVGSLIDGISPTDDVTALIVRRAE